MSVIARSEVTKQSRVREQTSGLPRLVAARLAMTKRTMPTIEELRKTRVEKLKKLQDAGNLAYPAKTNRTHSIVEVLKNWKKLSGI